MLSDQELMQQAAEGDLPAFAGLVDRHRERLERFLYRLSGDSEEAADCAQEALVKLWLRRREYRPQAQFTTYLYTIARRVWLDRAKREKRRPPVVPLEAQLGPAGRAMLDRLVREAKPVEAEVLRRYRLYRIRRAVQSLSPNGYMRLNPFQTPSPSKALHAPPGITQFGQPPYMCRRVGVGSLACTLWCRRCPCQRDNMG